MKIIGKGFVWMILIISTGLLFGVSELGLPNSIAYVSDALYVIAFFFALGRIKGRLRIPHITKGVVYAIMAFFLLSSFSALIHNVSMILYLWGVRNVFRYFVFSVSALCLIEIEDIKKFLKVVIILYWINFVVCGIQFFVMGLRGDYLGGIFGTIKGCNGVLSIFINFVLAYILAMYLCKKTSLVNLSMVIISYFVIAALSETKGNFLFFVMIVALEVVITKKNLKTFAIVFGSVIALIFGIQILTYFFPNSREILLDFESAMEYMDAAFYGRTTFTRNGMFGVANKYFFKDNPQLYICGYGMGACEHSVYFSSDFYTMYGNMHYRNYGMAMLLLQTGYVGLIIYCSIFASSALFIQRIKQMIPEEYNALLLATQVYTIFALVFTYYGYTMLADAGYFAWFIMAIPFILFKEYALPASDYTSKSSCVKIDTTNRYEGGKR